MKSTIDMVSCELEGTMVVLRYPEKTVVVTYKTIHEAREAYEALKNGEYEA